MTEIIKSKLVISPQHIQGSPTSVGTHKPGPVYPNRHSGRKFTNLLPNQHGINIPIRVRGEITLPTSDDNTVPKNNPASNSTQQLNQLNNLVGELKSNKNVQIIMSQRQPESTSNNDAQIPLQIQVEPVKKQPQKSTPSLKVQPTQNNLTMQSSMQVIQKESTSNKNPGKTVKAKEKKGKNEGFLSKLFKKDRIVETYEPMQNIPKIKEKETELKAEKSKPQTQIRPLQAVVAAVKTGGPKYAKINALTQAPNCLSGVVHDAQGRTLKGLVVVIKNKNNEPVRAIKTNSIGQFVTTTPLTNDVYTVIVDPAKTVETKFEATKIELKGKIVKPLEFVGN